MSKLNLSVVLNAYDDNRPSNAPSRSPISWARDLAGLVVNNPSSADFTIDPGTTQLLFSGMRTLLQDGTTEYSLALAPSQTSTYVLAWDGGTAPNFRTPRTTGADATTQIFTSVNGPTVTFTSSPGTYASFTGQIPGMILNVTITANNLGTGGNSVVLPGDGTSSINTLISNWNTANPSNPVTLTSGNGTQVPDAGTYASYTGTPLGCSTAVTITANTLGTNGSNVVLIGNGTSSISTLIAAWNTANPSNQVTLTSGDGTQIPAAGVDATYTGTPAGLSTPITITALTAGTNGNSIVLTGDGTSSVDTLVANWNINNPSNQVVLNSGNGAQIPASLAPIVLSGGVNPAMINLAGGVYGDITLSGGSTATQLNLISGGVVVGDYVTIGSNFNLSNQGTFQIIAVTANSFSVVNPNPIVEGPILLGSSFASQIQIYSAAGVQVGDTIVISSGFSPVVWGSYKITAVYAESLQFSSTAILPAQSSVMSEPVIYSAAKSLIYMESDSALTVIINGTPLTGTLEPFVVTNCATGLPTSALGYPTPGMLLLTATIWSLSVTNNSVDQANVFLAAVE